jgi:tripartite-type tricarboxylate transporter receptor subunit TctC
LASTWTRRIGALADLPTTGEQGFPEVQIAHWAGVHAPAGVPDEILDKMAAAIDAAMKSPATVEKLKKLGIEPIGGSRAQFVDFVNKERLRLGTIVKASTMQED